MSSMVIYKSTKEVHNEPFLGRGVSDYLVHTNPYKVSYKSYTKYYTKY